MSWTIRALPTVATAGASTINPTGAIVMNKPTGTTTNDLLVMVLVHHGSAYATLPVGWTAVAQEISGTIRGEIAWKRAGGAEPATYTAECPESAVIAGRILAYVGGLQSGDAVRLTATQSNGAGVNTCASVTPSLGDLIIGANMRDAESTYTGMSVASGSPSLFAQAVNNKGHGTSDLYGSAVFGFGAFWQSTANDATGTITWFPISSGDNVSLVVALISEPPPVSAPTNLYPQTATAIGALPQSITQDTTDAFSNDYDVWYSYTGQPTDHVIGLWGYGGGGAYQPRITIFDHVPPPPYTASPFVVGGANRPVQFPVTEDVTYYVKVARNALTGTATLQLEAEAFTDSTTPLGAFLINDDDANFPASTISSSTDNTVYAFLRTVHGPGESMAILPTGQLIIEDNDNFQVLWYPPDFASSVASPLDPTGSDQFYSTNKTDTFYILQNAASGDAQLYTMSAAGTLSATVRSLPTTSGVLGIAVNPDETILYYSDFSLKRYDLVNNVPLSDLVASTPGVSLDRLICLNDGSVVVVRITSSSAFDVKRYSSAGALLNTYTFAGVDNEDIRIANAADDPASFWIWLKQGTAAFDGISQFKNVRVSDGTVLDTVIGQEFELGAYIGTISATPMRFGHSESCDFVVMPLEVEPPGGGTATLIVFKETSPDTDTTSFSMTAGGGLSPGTFSLAEGESRTYSNVLAGTYSIVETEVSGYFTSYEVSNDSPNTAITVADGETVTVTVTNTITPPNSGSADPFTIRRLRRSPHVFLNNKRVFLSRLEPYFRAGIGTTSGQGIDAEVMLRVSKDGGNTWGAERILSAGALGRYATRLQAYRFGVARDWVFEVSVSDPAVPWVLVDLFADIEPENE